MNDLPRHPIPAASPGRPIGDRPRPSRRRSRGQILPLFAITLLVLMGVTALVIDVSWYWSNTLKVQRAADAAALAGAVWLPGAQGTAYTTARTEATKNGYNYSTAGITVRPCADSDNTTAGCSGGGGNPRQLNVKVSAPVSMFFMRVFGISSIPATRTAKAEYVQPVPMGSPLNYYGAYQDCKVSGSSIACSDIANASGVGALATQGFFGAVEGQGSNRSTGDAFATAFNSDPTPNNLASDPNGFSQYDHDGYDYMIEVPADGASFHIWDPTFCATTSGPGGGHLGAGDHWLSTANHGAAVPVSTYFRLYNTGPALFTKNDDVLVTESGSLFEDRFQVDKSDAYSKAAAAGGADNNFSDGTEPSLSSVADCQSDPYHNKWWQMASGLPAGIYRLQVTTTHPAVGQETRNQDEAFENMWSLEVLGAGGPGGETPRIYGQGRMVSYANITSGQQIFYLAQIDRRAGAGKTLIINLFDPGDVGDKAWLQILSPNGGTYAPVAFDYTADTNATSGHRSGTNVTCIQTYGASTAISPPAGGSPACTENYTSGGQFFQNSWITITIKLPTTYGATGLTPAGEPAEGWWKIKYTVNKGNDTTTWMVNLKGNPVHLVVN